MIHSTMRFLPLPFRVAPLPRPAGLPHGVVEPPAAVEGLGHPRGRMAHEHAHGLDVQIPFEITLPECSEAYTEVEADPEVILGDRLYFFKPFSRTMT